MTAEIVVINNTGIALAADSAVTMEYNRLVKINNSAEKLFELTKHHPVGIMIYNNATLGGSPWELIIKSYRAYLENRYFEHLQDYVHDFIDFINKNTDLITSEMRDNCAINLVIDNLKGLIDYIKDNNIVRYLNENPGVELDNAIFQEIVKTQLISEISILQNNHFFDGFNEIHLENAEAYISYVIRPYLPSIIVLDNGESVGDDLIELLVKYSSLLICKIHTSRTFSGIVITGYGNNEYYPSISTFHIYGIFRDNLMISHVPEKSHMQITDNGHVIPFAQEGEVLTFMDGCNPNIIKFNATLRDEVFDKLNNYINNNLYPVINNQALEQHFRNEIQQLKSSLVSEYNHKLYNYIHTNHTNKMTTMLQSLGKADLAYMAESLVNLTAFKRKVSHDYETVGGPVDVAVLSKYDGFVWVKRKHYFPRELNSSFFKRN